MLDRIRRYFNPAYGCGECAKLEEHVTQMEERMNLAGEPLKLYLEILGDRGLEGNKWKKRILQRLHVRSLSAQGRYVSAKTTYVSHYVGHFRPFDSIAAATRYL